MIDVVFIVPCRVDEAAFAAVRGPVSIGSLPAAGSPLLICLDGDSEPLEARVDEVHLGYGAPAVICCAEMDLTVQELAGIERCDFEVGAAADVQTLICELQQVA